MHEAKTQLSRLVERALAGEEVLIARAGTPLVRLQPIAPGTRAPAAGRPARALVFPGDGSP